MTSLFDHMLVAYPIAMITNTCSECSIDFPHSSDGASILFSEASDQYTAVAQLKSGIYSNV